ncbi:MAG: prepilin-type N-terminal cleavage/methylation domain-containing protein [Candidatus Wildermuthbacteria bacterium]|nr:prepilin-type N-terminal cleavage/methylation domain-containing protein [Candidatus Wildermuthbacteria bacterium]
MSRGFTIPELLVVIFIMSFMSGLVLVNWRAGERGLALDRAAHKLGQDVRRAQELAMRAQPFACAAGSISGYGVFFSQDMPESYSLFAECNGNNAYNDGTDGLVETVSLEPGISIQDVFPALPAVKRGSVVFLPPMPVIAVTSGTASPIVRTQMAVVLQRADDSSLTRRVTITNKGIIDID